ncbi:MAG TPA: dihydrodipicolinate synthase family protein, partial [Bacteroidales bacterium]|nr:dihydrodipicolinate synthase family protein [Bacteroidales bacterium]
QKEKFAVMHTAREAVPPEKLLLAGTGCESTRETITLTKEAARAGADAAVVLNPSFYKAQMDQETLKAHFFAVADASTIPIIIYNMPQNTGLDMSAEVIMAISGHPNVVGLKDSGGDLEKMRRIIANCKPDFQVLAGSAGFLLPALQIGAIGGILALANIAPAVCLKIVELFLENKQNEATELQRKIVELNAAVTRQWGVPALKAALDHLGLYGGIARKPLLKVSKENRERVLNLLEAIQNTPF